jgi:hypothetical protein
VDWEIVCVAVVRERALMNALFVLKNADAVPQFIAIVAAATAIDANLTKRGAIMG